MNVSMQNYLYLFQNIENQSFVSKCIDLGANDEMSIAVQLSPSALEVYNILLTKRKKMEKNEILAQTRYSTRSFYYAIHQLKTQNLIQIIPDIEDMRKTFYAIR